MKEYQKNISNLRYWLLATALLMFVLIMAGYLVRFNPGGSVCPDWPTCYGRLEIPQAAAARLEFGHRVLAGVTTLISLYLAIWVWIKKVAIKSIRWPMTLSAFLMVLQVPVGAGLVFQGNSGWAEPAHLGLALIAMSMVVVAAVSVFLHHAQPDANLSFQINNRSARLALFALVFVFILMISGSMVARMDAGQACAGWPLCGGGFPDSQPGWIAFGHRILTFISALVVLAQYIRTWRYHYHQPLVLTAVTASGLMLAGQIFIGAVKVSRGFPVDLTGLHAASSAGLWAALLVSFSAIGLSRNSLLEEKEDPQQQRVKGFQRIKAFIALNKPIIVLLLLVTTYAGMVVGGKQIPGVWLTVWTLLGGALAAGGSSALNQYIDRNIDGSMQRTAKRPLPSGRLTPAEGLAYGVGACLAAFFLLAGTVNLLAAVLSLAGMVYYVLIYSIWLKHATVQNIVIGGGAGAIPPLVGWAAATGTLNIPSLFLFAIVFMWTPPHFWALALVRAKDYARAGVPMLPVVKGEKETRTQIFIYTLELVGLTLLMPVFNIAGSIFLISAVVLGLWLIFAAWKVLRTPGNLVAWRMYRYSSMYLAFIFLALVMDVLILS